MGGGGKGQVTGRGTPFKGRTRRWPRAAETVGGNGGRERERKQLAKLWADKAAVAAV
jgi:hypothetical protein